jgi:hypothetical protein
VEILGNKVENLMCRILRSFISSGKENGFDVHVEQGKCKESYKEYSTCTTNTNTNTNSTYNELQ